GRRARQPAFGRDADPRKELAMTGDRPNVERGSAPTPNPTDRPNVERGSARTPNATDYTKPLPEISAEAKPFWDAGARHELPVQVTCEDVKDGLSIPKFTGR